MQYLKEDVANTVTVGPAVAVGDGFVPVTNLVGANADEYEIIKHGATTTTGISAALSAITGADGYYSLVLSSGECDTAGRMTLLINDDTLILPIRLEFMVLPTNVYDSLFGADNLQVDVIQILGGAIPTPAVTGVPDVNVTHQGDGAIPAPAVTGVPDVNMTHHADVAASVSSGNLDSNTTSMTNDVITSGKIATDGVDADALAAGAINKIARAIGIQKNNAFSDLEFLMVLSSDHVTPATGLTVTGERSIDGGAFVAVTGTITAVSDGIYQFDAVAADTNGDVITYRFSSATADDTFVTVKTVA